MKEIFNKDNLKSVWRKLIIIIIASLFVILCLYPGIVRLIMQKKYMTKDYMLEYRNDFSAVKLQDGRILITGGNRGFEALKTAEIYNPKTRESKYTGSLNVPRNNHVTILLNDGKVLLLGGDVNNIKYDRYKVEIYDPKTEKFTIIGDLNGTLSPASMNNLKFIKLKNGNILIFAFQDVLIYHPKTNRFVKITPIPYDYSKLDVTLLPSENEVFFVGDIEIWGKDKNSPYNKHYSSLILDTEKSKYKVGPDTTIRRKYIQTFNLKDGKILLINGYSDKDFINVIESYNPQTNKIEYIGKLLDKRNYYGAVLLQNGNLYFPNNNITESYNPLYILEIFKSFLDITPPSCEVFDLTTKESHYTPICLSDYKYNSQYFVLDNNKILIIGGESPGASLKSRREIITINTKELK